MSGVEFDRPCCKFGATARVLKLFDRMLRQQGFAATIRRGARESGLLERMKAVSVTYELCVGMLLDCSRITRNRKEVSAEFTWTLSYIVRCVAQCCGASSSA